MTSEFSTRLHIYLRRQVARISDGLVIPRNAEVPIVVNADDFDIVPSNNDSPASLLTTISKTVVCDKLAPVDANTLKIRRSVIIQLNRNGDNPMTIGTLDYPARIIYTPTLNRGVLKIEQKQPSHL